MHSVILASVDVLPLTNTAWSGHFRGRVFARLGLTSAQKVGALDALIRTWRKILEKPGFSVRQGSADILILLLHLFAQLRLCIPLHFATQNLGNVCGDDFLARKYNENAIICCCFILYLWLPLLSTIWHDAWR